MPEPNKKSKPRPFSLLVGPDVQKAAQEALHAPAKIPDSVLEGKTSEPSAELPAPEQPKQADTPLVGSPPAVSEPVEGRKPTSSKRKEKKSANLPVEEKTQNVAVSGSIHQVAKLAATRFGQSLRDLVEEAIEAHPNVKKMRKLLNLAED